MGSRGVAGAVPGERFAAVHIAEYRVVSARRLYSLGKSGSYSATREEADAGRAAHGSFRSGPDEEFGTDVRVVAKA